MSRLPGCGWEVGVGGEVGEVGVFPVDHAAVGSCTDVIGIVDRFGQYAVQRYGGGATCLNGGRIDLQLIRIDRAP